MKGLKWRDLNALRIRCNGKGCMKGKLWFYQIYLNRFKKNPVIQLKIISAKKVIFAERFWNITS